MCPQVDDITALVGGKVLPQAATGTLELDNQALARRAVGVAHIELAAPDAALREQVVQDRFQPIQQAGAQCLGVTDQILVVVRRRR